MNVWWNVQLWTSWIWYPGYRFEVKQFSTLKVAFFLKLNAVKLNRTVIWYTWLDYVVDQRCASSLHGMLTKRQPSAYSVWLRACVCACFCPCKCTCAVLPLNSCVSVSHQISIARFSVLRNGFPQPHCGLPPSWIGGWMNRLKEVGENDRTCISNW